MCLPHEYGIGHSNEMGTERWRITIIIRIEQLHGGTMNPEAGDIGEEERRRHIEIPEEAPVEVPEPEKVPA